MASQQGEKLAAASDILTRVFISGLDIAHSAHLRLEHWQASLDLLTEKKHVEQVAGESAEALVRTQFNRYGPLMKLGYLDEAQQVLEGCLRIDTKVGDLAGQATDLSALANVWKERGDVSHTIELARQGLAICERLSNPEDRAISHGNLSSYLHEVGQVEEGAKHRLAGIVYFLVTGNQQNLEINLRNLSIHMKEAKDYPLPSLNELLQQPEFSTLKRWLGEWKVNVGELQEQIDWLLSKIMQD